MDPDHAFRARLETDLAELCNDDVPVDFILVGGDIAYKADPGEYIAANGTCVVPQTFKLSNGYKLGGWVSTQRVKRDKLTPGRVARLEALCGWVWDRFDDKWETGFDHLRDYSLENGHCLAPYSYKLPDGYKLGIWVGSQQSSVQQHPS